MGIGGNRTLWRYGICTKGGDFKDTALAQKACTVVDCFMSDSREKGTLLPVIVWDDLLAAASSCPSIVPRPDLSDPVYDLNKRIIHELTRHVCLGPSLPGRVYCAGEPTSFGHALEADVNFVWSLLPPFDKHEGNVLDSKKVQHLLTLVNAIVSHELYEVSSNIFFGTCKALILELQVGSVTLKDQKAICVATDALVQEGIVLRDTLGPITVLLPSLIFLRCWKPNIMSRTAILHALIEIDMFKVLNRLGDKGLTWLWSANKNGFHSGNNTAPVASLITFVIRGSFESRTGPESQPEDFRWLEYLFLSENSAPIVAMFTFQGTRDAPQVWSRSEMIFCFSFLRSP
ncbi:hypothetical protein BDZ89DRAFT_643614 [Hymenopellis radicata]|nr:hypothetical protein BDZ89DRAFT_643614 [Hymenopellis radicata]